MRIGGGIALLVIGAILAFAIQFTVAGIDIALIGYILMAAGAVLLIVSIVVGIRGRSTTQTSRTEIDPSTGQRVTRTSRRDVDDY